MAAGPAVTLPLLVMEAPLGLAGPAADPFKPVMRALHPAGGVSACGVAHMQGMRGAMEDAYAACPVPGSPFLFLCVLDGHGGRAVADFAALRLLPCILATPQWAAAAAGGFVDSCALQAALQAGFAACDAAAYQALGAAGERSGACALAALVSPQCTIVANCGDCRAVLAGTALSTDHRPDAPSERARLAPLAGAAAAAGKSGYFQGLAVSRSLGDFRTKLDHARAAAGSLPPLLPAQQQTVTSNPEVVVVAAAAAATASSGTPPLLVMGCDGVWDVLSSQEAAELVAAAHAGGAAPEACAAALIQQCLERGSNDNLTALVAVLGAGSSSQ